LASRCRRPRCSAAWSWSPSRRGGGWARPGGRAWRCWSPRPAIATSDANRWVCYLLGPGLYQVETKDQKAGLLRDYLDGLDRQNQPRSTFGLDVRFCGDPHADGLFLWALVSYGGLGARVRRGFGGIHLAAASGADLPDGWTLSQIQAPTLDLWPAVLHTGLTGHVDHQLTSALADIAPNGPTSQATGVGDYPQLNTTNWRGALTLTAGSWPGVLAAAGEKWRRFRATEQTPGVRYQPPLKAWEWLHTINGPSDRFPLGATGLPIVFKKNNEVAPDVDGQPGRRPSPIWFRAVGSGTTWRLLTFAFRHHFLPPHTPVRHRLDNSWQPGQLTVTHHDVLEASDAWLTQAPRPTP
jgi:CRISPR-associated protein Cmr1